MPVFFFEVKAGLDNFFVESLVFKNVVVKEENSLSSTQNS
jgi:hypothetical protein